MAVKRVAFVVDDEGVIASTLELILISHGFEARAFVDPLDALSATQSALPDLLFTDVMMPQMNGIELAVRLRQLCPNCQVLLSSGQPATSELLADAEAAGHHFEILAKPIHPDTLIEKIEELFRDGVFLGPHGQA
jgi:CheY-like chemotaxis protein